MREEMILDVEIEEGDYVISDIGPLGSRTAVSQFGKRVGIFDCEEAALYFVEKRAHGNNFYPSTWKLDDHGGYTLLV